MRLSFPRWLGRSADLASVKFDVLLKANQDGRNILIFSEYINATYFISFDIPLRGMHERGEINVAVVSQDLVNDAGVGCWERWAAAIEPDIVVMTRYGLPYGPDILDFFRTRGTPIIYHIDDDLLDVPDSLGAEIKQRQGSRAVVDARRYLLERCDLIYASTACLADILSRRCPRQPVFHGIYAPYMGDRVHARLSQRRCEVIGYMGSKGHQPDLDLVVPALERLLVERPGLRFEVFGTIRMPARLERFGDRVYSRPGRRSYLQFLDALASLGWNVGLAPLVDSPFNRCKAATKYVEYTAGGIPVIASDVPVYSEAMPVDGGILVRENWHEAISYYLDSASARDQALEVARNHCREAYSMQALEKQLRNVLDIAQQSSARAGGY